MRIRLAEFLRRLAHKVDPGYSARRGLEVGRKWAEEMTPREQHQKSLISHQATLTDGPIRNLAIQAIVNGR